MATRAQHNQLTAMPHGGSPVTAVQPAERCFMLAWSWLRPPATDGLVAVLDSEVSTSWADQVLAHAERGSVVWAVTAAQAERYGRATLERPGVRAVSLAPAAAEPQRVGAALQVASYLARVRSGGLAPTRPYLTSPDRPAATPDDLIRIPHLVTMRAADEATADAVV